MIFFEITPQGQILGIDASVCIEGIQNPDPVQLKFWRQRESNSISFARVEFFPGRSKRTRREILLPAILDSGNVCTVSADEAKLFSKALKAAYDAGVAAGESVSSRSADKLPAWLVETA